MTGTDTTANTPSPYATADSDNGAIAVTVDLAAAPQRVFQALASPEILDWWVRPGVFDTRNWIGELVVGGRWEASGIGNGRPYTLEGEYLEISPPHRLVHSWQAAGAPIPPTRVTYRLEPHAGGTRLTLDHTGFVVPEMLANTRAGWETSLTRLAEILVAEDMDAD